MAGGQPIEDVAESQEQALGVGEADPAAAAVDRPPCSARPHTTWMHAHGSGVKARIRSYADRPEAGARCCGRGATSRGRRPRRTARLSRAGPPGCGRP